MKYAFTPGWTIPRNGLFVINRPDLGFVGSGYTFDHLVVSVTKYRKANGIPIGIGFEDELLQAICAIYNDHCEPTDTILPLKSRRTYSDIIAGTKVLVSFKLAGSPFVSKEEAEKRGEICSNCKLCVMFPKPCVGLCSELKGLVDGIINSTYQTRFDNDMRSCQICSCYYSSAIRIPYEYLEKGINDDQKAQFQEAAKQFQCWRVPPKVIDNPP